MPMLARDDPVITVNWQELMILESLVRRELDLVMLSKIKCERLEGHYKILKGLKKKLEESS